MTDTSHTGPQIGSGTVKVEPDPPAGSFWLSLSGIIGTMALFLIIVGLAYVYNQPPGIDEELYAVRTARLQEIQGEQASILQEVTWSDQEKGMVTMPIEDAMELTVRNIQSAAEAKKVWRPTAPPPDAGPPGK